MRRYVMALPLLAAVVVALWSGSAAADPIRLTGYGSALTVDTHNSPSGWFQPAADTWFWFRTPASLAWNPPCPCPVGSLASASNRISGWIPGGAHLPDALYRNLVYYADLDFKVDPTKVREAGRFGMQDAPDFAFQGTLVAWDSAYTRVLFTHTFEGWGSTRFAPNPLMFRPNYRPNRLIYQFDAGAPVPEPATLLMLAAGVGATVRKRRTRNRGELRQRT